MANILIVYYSRKGQNYWNGSVKNITKGNTERVAEFIQEAVGGDLFEIDTVKPYDEDYYVCIEEAKKELHEGARPELKRYPDNLDAYDSIFVGFPKMEYGMSRTLSPMMVAEYQLQLPDKNILQKKLQELINIPLLEDDIPKQDKN